MTTTRQQQTSMTQPTTAAMSAHDATGRQVIADLPGAIQSARILWALRRAVEAGAGEDWDHPAAEMARLETAAAGMRWDFSSWRDALECAEGGMLGGVRVAI